LQLEFITPHCPEQNGLVERVIRTIKEQCVHRQRFETLPSGFYEAQEYPQHLRKIKYRDPQTDQEFKL
jgi:hypothetical protein